jgi:hypothetical protein
MATLKRYKIDASILWGRKCLGHIDQLHEGDYTEENRNGISRRNLTMSLSFAPMICAIGAKGAALPESMLLDARFGECTSHAEASFAFSVPA